MSDFFPVAESGNLPTADLAETLIEVGNAVADGSVSYLKYSKSGNWVFGRDDDEIDPDELLAVNPASFTIGWQGWDNGTPVNGPVVPIGQRASLPVEADLESIPAGEMNGWNKMLGVTLRTMSDGTTLQYNVTSYGGKQAVTKLMREVGLGLAEHIESPVALVKLSGESYKHAKYGTIWSPILTVVGWADGEGKEVKKLAVKPAK